MYSSHFYFQARFFHIKFKITMAFEMTISIKWRTLHSYWFWCMFKFCVRPIQVLPWNHKRSSNVLNKKRMRSISDYNISFHSNMASSGLVCNASSCLIPYLIYICVLYLYYVLNWGYTTFWIVDLFLTRSWYTMKSIIWNVYL